PVPQAPLASLMAVGTVALRLPDAPALAFEAPLFLALRDALAAAGALVHAWEAGERTFSLHLGPATIEMDLTRDEVRAPGWTRAGRALTPHGRVRRLVFRPSWNARLAAEPVSLHLFGRAVTALLPQEAVGFELDAGQRLWSVPCAGPHALARAQSGSDVFVLG